MVAWIGRQLRLLALAAQAGHDEAARETARATEAKHAAEDAQRRSAFLSEASRELSLSLEMRQVLDRVAAMSVPLLGDLCFVDTSEDGGGLRRTAAAHRNRSKQRFLEELPAEPPYAALPDFATALQSDRPVIVSELSPELRSAIGAGDPHLIEVLDPRSLLIAPLSARGRTFGAITFVHAESRRTYATEDVVLAWELSRRVALAVDNARLYEEMQQALRSREEILAIVSHDLRSPLTTISMTAAVLQEMPADPEDLREHMGVIQTSVKRMTRLITDLLDVTRMDAGHKLPIEASELELSAVVDELIHIFAPQAEARGLTLRIHSELDGTRVYADRDRMVQAISNLLGNALKFTPDGGSVELTLKRQEAHVLIVVADSGPGIPEENLHRIWDPYWQMKRNARMGAGLGLAIVRGIVEAHGGRVWVESEVGRGAAFHMMIPMVPEASGVPANR
jgi:signal transduction histidine kinase